MNRAGNTALGFVNLAYQTILGRAPTSAEQTTWLNQSNRTTTLPNSLLRSEEYLRNMVNEYYLTYLRRLPNTLADGGAQFPSNVTYAAQDKVAFLVAGGNPETIELDLVNSEEYRRLALTKALWTGKRWKR